MEKDFKQLDSFIHEIRKRTLNKKDRKMLIAILKEHIRILEREEFEDMLESEPDPWVLQLEDVSLKFKDQDLKLNPGETIKLKKVDLERTTEGEFVIELSESNKFKQKNKAQKK